MCHLRLMVMLGTEPELCAHWTSRQLTYELPSFLPLKQPYYVALNLSQPCFRPECWNCKAALSHLLPLVLTSGSEEFGLSFSVRNDENVNSPPPPPTSNHLHHAWFRNSSVMGGGRGDRR